MDDAVLAGLKGLSLPGTAGQALSPALAAVGPHLQVEAVAVLQWADAMVRQLQVLGRPGAPCLAHQGAIEVAAPKPAASSSLGLAASLAKEPAASFALGPAGSKAPAPWAGVGPALASVAAVQASPASLPEAHRDRQVLASQGYRNLPGPALTDLAEPEPALQAQLRHSV